MKKILIQILGSVNAKLQLTLHILIPSLLCGMSNTCAETIPMKLDYLSLGETFLIRTPTGYNFCDEAIAPNDSCYNAIYLEGSEAYASYAMEDVLSTDDLCSTSPDLWYKFVASTKRIALPAQNNNNIVYSLYKGECESLEFIGCYDRFSRIEDLEIGTTYYFNASSDQDEIEFRLANIPDNDSYSEAQVIEADTCIDASLQYISGKLWYKFTALQESYHFELTSRNLEIYKSDENDQLSLISGYSNSGVVELTEGETYYFAINGNSTFRFCIEEVNSLINGRWTKAIPLNFEEPTNCTEIIGLSTNLWEGDSISCIPRKYDSDAWYSFVAPSGSILIKGKVSSVSNGAEIQLYKSELPHQTYLDCPLVETTLGNGLGFTEGKVLRDLDTGATYLIRVLRGFDFCISLAPTNENDNLGNAIDLGGSSDFSCSSTRDTYFSANNSPTDSSFFAEPCLNLSADLYDLWYTFIAEDTRIGIALDPPFLGELSSLVFEVYTLENDQLYCHSIQSIGLPSGLSSRIENLTVGQKYYLRMLQPRRDEPLEILDRIPFCLFQVPPVPANDLQENAIELLPSDNLTECNATDFLQFSGSNGNSVWHKFTASSESHQLLVYSESVWFDTNLFAKNSAGDLEIISTHEHLEFVFDGQNIEQIFDKYYPYIKDNFAITLHNYKSLEIGKEYYIQIGVSISNSDILYLTHLDLVNHAYVACLKTLPLESISTTFDQAQELYFTNDSTSRIASEVTLSKADLSVYESLNFCPEPLEYYRAFYPESWFYFQATQSTGTLFIENLAKYSEYAEQLDNYVEGPVKSHDLTTYISIFRNDSNGLLESLVCSQPVSSLYLLDKLTIGETYYIRVHYGCLNYLTDLHFNIGLSTLVDLDQDGYFSDLDCDDTNFDINPNQTEEPYNGIDDDCNPATLDDDLDQDGFLLADDCDDSNPNINPSQIEEPYNGIDDDCNQATFDDDLDQDGFFLADDCDDSNPNINPSQVEEPYNGINDDCDTATFDDDLDQDGFLLTDDCDDENNEINPDAIEIPNNGIDENCDGMDLISSTHELSKSRINIFPNPASDIINIDVEGDLKFIAAMFNLNGKLIKYAMNAFQMDIDQIPNGTYLLEIKDINSNQKIVERIVIGR